VYKTAFSILYSSAAAFAIFMNMNWNQSLALLVVACNVAIIVKLLLVAVVDDGGVVFDASHEGRQNSAAHLSRLRSPDVPLACPLVDGDLPHIFPAPLQPLTGPISGFAFNIYNNIWDTNYIMWYPYRDADAHFRARFHIDV